MDEAADSLMSGGIWEREQAVAPASLRFAMMREGLFGEVDELLPQLRGIDDGGVRAEGQKPAGYPIVRTGGKG